MPPTKEKSKGSRRLPIKPRAEVLAQIQPQHAKIQEEARRKRSQTQPTKIKVAVLGGGMASIAAAFELSRPPLNEQFELTVYQRGWRLGGKGASGRNRDIAHRIEEHGLHVWFGFYDNAFKLMRECYDKLGRDPGKPLATFAEAFKPAPNIVLYEKVGDSPERWIPWEFNPPANNLKPGDEVSLPKFWEVARQTLDWLYYWWHYIYQGTNDAIEDFERAVSLARRNSQAAEPPSDDRGALIGYITKFETWLFGNVDDVVRGVKREIQNARDQIRLFKTIANTAFSSIRGMVHDRFQSSGFAGINDVELSKWLSDHGAKPETLKGPLVTAWYDMAFAYVNGDTNNRNMAAGTALTCMLRLLFTYKGAFAYKMQAGMGDTVFAPFYEVLKRRGVKFEFFRCVTKLIPSKAKSSKDPISIEAIELIHQADLKSNNYEPLCDVNGLRCWPSEPLWAQLNLPKGFSSKDRSNFEWEQDPLTTKKIVRLELGKDFDKVVLGIPVGALKTICKDLSKANPKFAEMLDNAETTMTQAFQLWMDTDLHELGAANLEDCTMTGFVEPFDTYADMSHLISAEKWPAKTVKSIGYFCNVLQDIASDSQSKANARAKQNSIDFLNHEVQHVWPAFDWGQLVDIKSSATGQKRFDSQWWIANFQPSERYTLTPAGKVKYRLQTDQTGFENLFLAGDWIKTGLDAGCIEAATLAGRQAARAIRGKKEKDMPFPNESDDWLKGF
jgi:uncharacterized protein with NAD-binding domain and iron-sulfur cluster